MTDAPGLRERPRKGGVAYYWVATSVSRKAEDYPTRTVRLHAATHEGRAQRCRELTAELNKWLADSVLGRTGRFGGCVRDLIRAYQHDEYSPYQSVRHSTRNDYDYSLDLLEKAIGGCIIVGRTRKDIMRWYQGFRVPKQEGGTERIRRAHGCMKMLRILTTYGHGERYPGCAELRQILSDIEFELPAARDEAMTYAQALAVVDHAIKIGRSSIAIAQALQFECSLRQIDAIGYWTPAAGAASGIMDRGSAWAGGVTWSDISSDMVLKKRTTKTAARGEWDLARLPLVMRALACVPAERRVGPLVISEATGLPYRANYFQRDWRAIARAVGIPDRVQNRDSRAGGITEGDLAGADARDLQKLATHSDPKTTNLYIRSTTRKATDNVATLRAKAREK